jgi:hypothetical protein
MRFTAVVLAGSMLGLACSSAFAHGDVRCEPKVPRAEWRSHNDLHRKLTEEGWVIRQMKETPTCYEVYAKDPKGKRVEGFFHPKTFERVE